MHVIPIICFYFVVVDSYITPRHWYSFRRVTPLSSSKSISEPSTQVVQANDDPSYIQWNRQKDTWNMQTAVTTFRRGDQTVELHAQQHFGDADYFRYWNSRDFNKGHDCVLFELLLDDELLEYRLGDWCVTQPIMASVNDQSFAQNLGLQCQASIIDYTHPKWAHADLSRQEFTNLAIEKNGGDKNKGDYSNIPLWKLASQESSSTAGEAVRALLNGPPTLDYSTNKSRKRRLFTNLFLPGSQLAFTLRALLWMTVPSPELSIILLDWSSLLQGGSNPSALSEVAIPILSSLIRFDINQMRRFLFGQVVMSSNINSGGRDNPASSWSLLIANRNDHALNVLTKKLDDNQINSVALLYGSSHCPDLHNKLVAMGFQQTNITWRTVWSVEESKSMIQTATANVANETQGLPALGIFLVFYLIIGALDWVGIVGDTFSQLFDSNYIDMSVYIALYLVRHVLLYLGLSKFLIDWTNSGQ